MIICDAGGGTVVSHVVDFVFSLGLTLVAQDLITYEIQQIKPFVVKEIVKGEGE